MSGLWYAEFYWKNVSIFYNLYLKKKKKKKQKKL